MRLKPQRRLRPHRQCASGEQPITLRACDAHSNADDGINITNDANVEQVTALSNIGAGISVTGALTAIDVISANNQTGIIGGAATDSTAVSTFANRAFGLRVGGGNLTALDSVANGANGVEAHTNPVEFFPMNVQRNGGVGVSLEATGTHRFTRAWIRRNSGHGVHIIDSISIGGGQPSRDFVADYNGGSGVHLTGTGQLHLLGATLRGNTISGISGDSADAAAVTLDQVTINNNRFAGVDLLTGLTCTNSDIRDNGKGGLYLGGDSALDNVSITNNGFVGLQQWAGQAELVRVDIHNNRQDGLRVIGPAAVDLRDSDITDNGGDAAVFRVTGPSNQAVGQSAIAGSNLSGSSGMELWSNTAEGTIDATGNYWGVFPNVGDRIQETTANSANIGAFQFAAIANTGVNGEVGDIERDPPRFRGQCAFEDGAMPNITCANGLTVALDWIGSGNNLHDPGEHFDDCNIIDCDGCTNSCHRECGDGEQQVFEDCDDGNALNGDGCDQDCTLTGCGNGLVTAGEACDSGRANGEAGQCLEACIPNTCGDGIVDAGEECDDANRTPIDRADACANDCTGNRCGDGIVGPGEE